MPLRVGELPDTVERVAELLRQPRADLVARPEQPAEVLHPLEVRDRHAAGVREDVGQDRDAALARGSRRASIDVGPFAPSTRSFVLEPRRVLRRHLILERGEHEDVAGQLEQLGVA